MEQRERIKAAIERQEKALGLRPGIGQRTARTRVRLREGMVCEIEEGPWKLVADLPMTNDDIAAGPTPGVLGRGALGTCLTMTYVIWAAKLGFPLHGVEVEVEADYDARGDFGIEEAPVGYSEVRYMVSIETDADEDAVTRFLDRAESHTTYLRVFAEPQTMRREVRITAPGSE